MNELRFAIISTGFWARYQLAAWLELKGVRCVALYNRTRVKAAKLAQEFGAPAIYDDVRNSCVGRSQSSSTSSPTWARTGRSWNSPTRGWLLDEGSVERAMREPESFLAQRVEWKSDAAGVLELGLKRYAFAWFDLE